MSAQERFLLLVGPEPGAQAWAKRRLEPMHRGLGKGSAAISVDAFPVRWAQEADLFDGTVSFKRAGIGVQDRSGSRWSDQSKPSLAGGNVTTAPVIGTVADDLAGAVEVSGGQEGLEGLRILGLAWGRESRDNQGRGRIDAEVDLAVGASPVSVDSGEPRIWASDLKAG